MTILSFRTLFIVALLLSPFHLARAEEAPQPKPKYAEADYAAYAATPFANPKWDPFVKEGFNAFDKEDLPTTIEFLRKVVQLGCTSPLVYFKLALSYEAQGSYYSAIQYYDLAKGAFENGNRDHRYFEQFDESFGRALYMLGQKDKALAQFEKVAKKRDVGWILKMMAEHYLGKEDYLKALPYVERLMNLPDSPLTNEEKVNIQLTYARYYFARNETDSGERYYRKVLELDPQNAEAGNYFKAKEGNERNKKLLETMEKF